MLQVSLLLLLMMMLAVACSSDDTSKDENEMESGTEEEMEKEENESTDDMKKEEMGEEDNNAEQVEQKVLELEKNELEMYHVQLPIEWDKQVDEQLNTIIAWDTNVVNGVLTNINVLIEELGEGSTLEQYSEVARQSLTSFFVDYNEVSYTDVTVNDVAAKEIIYTYTNTPEGSNEKIALQNRQTILMKDDYAYVISFATTQKEFDSYENIVNDITNSFEIKS